MALITLSATVFVVVSAEMMPTAVLPMLAADLGVGLAAGGLLVSAWAATVVVASFPLTRLMARRDRPAVIAGALVVVALATLVTAAAPTYAVAMGSRLVAAAATGLLWATVNVHAVSIVREQSTARATAVVLFGGTAGTVVSLPAGNALAELAGWRIPFLVLGVAALVVAVAVRLLLRTAPVLDEVGETALGTGERRPLWPVVAIGALGGLVLAAHFMPFTFVAEILAPSSLAAPLLLVVLGGVGVLGGGGRGRGRGPQPRPAGRADGHGDGGEPGGAPGDRLLAPAGPVDRGAVGARARCGRPLGAELPDAHGRTGAPPDRGDDDAGGDESRHRPRSSRGQRSRGPVGPGTGARPGCDPRGAGGRRFPRDGPNPARSSCDEREGIGPVRGVDVAREGARRIAVAVQEAP